MKRVNSSWAFLRTPDNWKYDQTQIRMQLYVVFPKGSIQLFLVLENLKNYQISWITIKKKKEHRESNNLHVPQAHTRVMLCFSEIVEILKKVIKPQKQDTPKV